MTIPTELNRPPQGHPISFEKAKELIEGSLGYVYRDIALSCCAPLIWYRILDSPCRILHNGTLTAVRTPKMLFGITAAHVLDQYDEDAKNGGVTLQLKNHVIDSVKIIDFSSKRDLTTIELDERLISALELKPLSWPPRPPTEGRGLLIAGFPGNARLDAGTMKVDWSPFFGINTARTVTDEQITILIPRNEQVKNSMPTKCDLGGISGGPIIGIFETQNYLAFHALSGVIVEHPNYGESDFSVERIVGVRADVVTESGRIR